MKKMRKKMQKVTPKCMHLILDKLKRKQNQTLHNKYERDD